MNMKVKKNMKEFYEHKKCSIFIACLKKTNI